MLLHDIAKGRGGDHSILGAEVARSICPRLGLSVEETEIVAWLIRHHLLMSETAFRYDLNDPMTITNFAREVQSPERLNLPLVLTVADIRAGGAKCLEWLEGGVMRELYARTMAVLCGENADEAMRHLEAEAKSASLRHSLPPTGQKRKSAPIWECSMPHTGQVLIWNACTAMPKCHASIWVRKNC